MINLEDPCPFGHYKENLWLGGQGNRKIEKENGLSTREVKSKCKISRYIQRFTVFHKFLEIHNKSKDRIWSHSCFGRYKKTNNSDCENVSQKSPKWEILESRSFCKDLKIL